MSDVIACMLKETHGENYSLFRFVFRNAAVKFSNMSALVIIFQKIQQHILKPTFFSIPQKAKKFMKGNKSQKRPIDMTTEHTENRPIGKTTNMMKIDR